jgi:hypothetical protein
VNLVYGKCGLYKSKFVKVYADYLPVYPYHLKQMPHSEVVTISALAFSRKEKEAA